LNDRHVKLPLDSSHTSFKFGEARVCTPCHQEHVFAHGFDALIPRRASFEVCQRIHRTLRTASRNPRNATLNSEIISLSNRAPQASQFGLHVNDVFVHNPCLHHRAHEVVRHRTEVNISRSGKKIEALRIAVNRAV